jgi:hypothetical protein
MMAGWWQQAAAGIPEDFSDLPDAGQTPASPCVCCWPAAAEPARPVALAAGVCTAQQLESGTGQRTTSTLASPTAGAATQVRTGGRRDRDGGDPRISATALLH